METEAQIHDRVRRYRELLSYTNDPQARATINGLIGDALQQLEQRKVEQPRPSHDPDAGSST
jgi:hypothetical protein